MLIDLKSQRRTGGRPSATQKMPAAAITRARELYASKAMTVAEIMALTGFKNRGTFYKYVVNA